ncbi:MAG: phenylalanine--tRNA ligase subunit beta, partial [Bacteroidota bacterium]|nr:phenylalanine--tRNA ligase subunit beta [Bacteroidota bacterium]
MKISFNWLKDYVDIGDVEPQELAEILTDTGLEVEGLEKFESVKGGLEGILIGKVLTCEKHPNADRLTVTTVDIGAENPLPIVCGAPNVTAGQKVLVATVGTTLNMDEKPFTIQKSKIRGSLSEGMICAEDEIGLGNSHEGIIVLEDNVPVGKLAKDHFEISEDWVFEIGLTPNRTDATAHIGVARDIVAALNQQRKLNLKLNLPAVDDFQVGKAKKKIDIKVDDLDACPRYTGLTITGIQVKESPDWLRNRLNAIGIRPINNIVDITNYILMETGHPLHAFDADQIKGDTVVIRKANPKEQFITLDEVNRELQADDLMICNVKDGMCIAGVFGGITSGVTDKTRDIFL